MKKCVILTLDDPTDFVIYDQLLEPYLQDAGWHCETLSWRAKVDWNNYNLVMIRSTWDYQDDVEGFMQVLQKIEDSSAHLDNPLAIARWNIDKRYMRDLEARDVSIVPTLWFDSLHADQIAGFFTQLNTTQIVIKPCISANADDTFWLKQNVATSEYETIAARFQNRPFMVQPFLPAIISEGEFSLFYFDGDYSHAILKTPKQDDFRVQEEHGGRLLKIEPEAALYDAAEKVLKAIDQSLLYARLDFVRNGSEFALMEAELIEPSLYFNLDPEAPRRYVEAMERRMVRLGVI
jgi:glutathione synthase/RimK-type ligase-like ATP-grasp enzyme